MGTGAEEQAASPAASELAARACGTVVSTIGIPLRRSARRCQMSAPEQHGVRAAADQAGNDPVRRGNH
jgi:hypothetical protein